MDDPHVEVEIKPQLKPRGSGAKEEDPKPSHQLYKYFLTKENALALIAVDIGGKNTQE